MAEQSLPVGRQQRLSELTTVVNAPGIVLSQPTGDIGHGAIEGYFLDDRRVLSHLTLTVDDAAPEHLVTAQPTPEAAEFTALAAASVSSAADFGIQGDPQVIVVRRRLLDAHGLRERVEVRSLAERAVSATVALTLGTDGVSVSLARVGGIAPLLTPRVEGADTIGWVLDDSEVTVRATPRPSRIAMEGGLATATWSLRIEPQSIVVVEVRATAAGELQQPTSARRPDAGIVGDAALTRLFDRSLADAYALVRTDAADPRDHYVSAGAPWYLTLFGRDSLWAARMLLPVDPDLALGTLRALARRQGAEHVPGSAEQPGKVLHELRRQAVADLLPAVYYGTADATSLWVVLLVEAWRWGATEDEVVALLPQLRAALEWLAARAESSASGFIEYTPDPSGLANQGWKDSRDAIHNGDGDHHTGDVALAEVQGYAYSAASGAADLLEHLGDAEGAYRWREWAAAMRARFDSRFWVTADGERFPATALIGNTFLADSASSNMGHLLETGIVSDAGAADIARRLRAPDLSSAFGLRTLSTRSPRFNPVSYHNGSIWPHDTAIAVRGLAYTGHTELATRLSRAVVAAGEAFDERLPELWSGFVTDGADTGTRVRPVPYPTACSPQAWSSAAVVNLVTASLGLTVDVPRGRVEIRPVAPAPFGAIEVHGIRIGGGRLDLRVSDAGEVTVLSAPEGIAVVAAGEVAAAR